MMTQSIIYGGPPKWEGIWENLIHVVLGNWQRWLCFSDKFFTDEHLPCISQDQLAKQTHCFSTMYLSNIIPDNPRAGQKHWCFCMK